MMPQNKASMRLPDAAILMVSGALPTLNRIFLAFRAFFALLFGGSLSDALLTDLGLVKRGGAPPRPAPAATKPAETPKTPITPTLTTEDGALKLLGMLQQEGRLLDFFMEDIAPYSDDQVGGAVRDVHEKTRAVLVRHFAPVPVIDAVEGTPVSASDPLAAKAHFIGNLPASGRPKGGLLRHKGWKATTASMPKPGPKEDLMLLATPEIEVE
jgi:hypothetical protein